MIQKINSFIVLGCMLFVSTACTLRKNGESETVPVSDPIPQTAPLPEPEIDTHSEPEPVQGPEEEPEIASPPLPYFKVRVIPEPSLNEYSVELDWSEEIKPGAWYIYRGIMGRERLQIDIVSGTESHFIDKTVTPNTRYEYFVLYYKNGDPLIRGRADINVPFDVDLNKGPLIKKGAKRVFLSGELRLNADLDIEAEEFISHNGIIHYSLCPLSDKPNAIRLKAKRASGDLKIVTHGPDGRNGVVDNQPGLAPEIKGVTRPTEYPPIKGCDSAEVTVDVNESDSFYVDVDRKAGKGGRWLNFPHREPAPNGKLREVYIRLGNHSHTLPAD